MSPEYSGQDPRVYLAAERAFLAGIRTGLALMGFGFVVAPFGSFFRELAASHGIAQTDPSAVSPPLRIGLVLLGLESIRKYSDYCVDCPGKPPTPDSVSKT